MLLCSILFNTAVSMLTSMYISQSAQYQIGIIYNETWASQVAQRLKHLPAMREAWVRSLGQEDPWRNKWHPTPVFFPGESHGWRSLVGCCLWGHTESDMTEATQQQQQLNKSRCILILKTYIYINFQCSLQIKIEDRRRKGQQRMRW